MNRNHWFATTFHRLVIRNFRDKLLSLVLALILYAALSSSGLSFQIEDIPVRLILPEKIVLRDDLQSAVTIRISAPRALRERLNNQNLVCTVEVPADAPTDRPFEVTLSEANFQLPPGVVIRRILPAELVLHLEEMVQVAVPVEATFNPQESPAPGYQVATVQFSPEMAQVSGPASLVANLKTVPTAPIPLDNSIDENFQYSVALREPGDMIAIQPATVMASVFIERDNDRHTVRGLPLRIIPGHRMTSEVLTPGTMRLEVAAPPSELGKLSADDFLIYLDLTELLEPGEYDVAPRAVTTSGADKVRIESISPNPVRVRVRKLSDSETGADNRPPNSNN